MIIVDANIWIDHLRATDDRLGGLIQRRRILIHPYTIGEVALGSFSDREVVIDQLALLPSAPVAEHDEVLTLIERYRLFGTGIGYVDSHLLASTQLASDGKLWTRDKRLHAQAERLGVAASFG